jgi:hypothetical protein
MAPEVAWNHGQGNSDGFAPPRGELDRLDESIDVADPDAILVAQRPAPEPGPGAATTISAGSLKNDLSPDLVSTEPILAELHDSPRCVAGPRGSAGSPRWKALSLGSAHR